MAGAFEFLLGALVVILAVHVAVLAVALVRAVLPGRRDPTFLPSMMAGVAALLGELLLLGGISSRGSWTRAAPLFLALGLGLALFERNAWRAHLAGQAARQAVVAAAIGLPLAALVLFT